MSDFLQLHGLHGILQARILEWVAIPFSRGSSQPRDGTQVSHTAGRFFTTEGSPQVRCRCLKFSSCMWSPGVMSSSPAGPFGRWVPVGGPFEGHSSDSPWASSTAVPLVFKASCLGASFSGGSLKGWGAWCADQTLCFTDWGCDFPPRCGFVATLCQPLLLDALWLCSHLLHV